MKILKRIIYTILGLVLTGAVGLVCMILYAEYSGQRFNKESISALAVFDSSEDSRLQYDENGNIAELPNQNSNSSADTSSEESDANGGTSISDITASITASMEQPYVMDLGTALFHTPDCPIATAIASEDRSDMTTTRDKIINAGYNACTACNP